MKKTFSAAPQQGNCLFGIILKGCQRHLQDIGTDAQIGGYLRGKYK